MFDPGSDSDESIPDWIVNSNVYTKKKKTEEIPPLSSDNKEAADAGSNNLGANSKGGVLDGDAVTNSNVIDSGNTNAATGSSGGILSDSKWEDPVKWMGAQHTLILIDCAAAMFEPVQVVVKAECIEGDEEGDFSQQLGQSTQNSQNSAIQPSPPSQVKSYTETPFDIALRIATRLMEIKVSNVAMESTGTRDGVGILLYGTKRYAIPGNPSKTTKFIVPLAPPGVNEITELNELLRPIEELIKESEKKKDGYDGGVDMTGMTQSITSQTQTTNLTLMEEFGDLKNENSEASEIAKQMGHNNLSTLRSAINAVSLAFSQAKCVRKPSKNQVADLRRVWIMTNNDNPVGGNMREGDQIVRLARDCAERGIEMDIWPLPTSDKSKVFNKKLFYHRIITGEENWLGNEDEDGGEEEDDKRKREPMNGLDYNALFNRVQHSFKRRTRMARLPIHFGPAWGEREGAGISVDVHFPIQVKRRPLPKTINSETNVETVTRSLLINQETGELLHKEQLDTYMELGGEKISMKREELDKLKRISAVNQEPGCRIVGFKDMSTLNSTLNIDKAYFLYPSDEEVAGSRAAFVALWKAMKKRNVYAVGEFLLKVTANAPRLVALVVQEEVRVAKDTEQFTTDVVDSIQIKPPGFQCIFLPYEDDIRDIDAATGGKEGIAEAGAELVNYAKDLIQSLPIQGLEWEHSFSNPATGRFWKVLEAMAFGKREDFDTFTDDTVLDDDLALELAGDELAKFKNSLPPLEEVNKKRKVPGSNVDRVPVKDETGYDWDELFDNEEIPNLTVSNLKHYLRAHCLLLGGLKKDLVARIEGDILEKRSKKENLEVKRAKMM